MNKKFIALAVAALVSGAANAASIYDDGTTSFGVSGEIDVFVNQFDSDADGQDTDLDADVWAKVQFDAEHKVTEDITLFGSFEMENGNYVSFGNLSNDAGTGDDNNDSNSVSTDDLYFGAMFGDSFGIAAGETGDFADSDNAIVIDNTNEGYGYVDDFIGNFESSGHMVAAKFETNGLVLVADTYLAQDEELDNAYGVSASYTISGFNVAASYQDHGNRTSYDEGVDGTDNGYYGFKAGYSADAFSIATHYVVREREDRDEDVIGLAADYKFDAARVYASGFVSDRDEAEEDFTAYTLGTDYAVSNNLLVFLEYSAQENPNYVANDTDNTLYNLGMYYSF